MRVLLLATRGISTIVEPLEKVDILQRYVRAAVASTSLLRRYLRSYIMVSFKVNRNAKENKDIYKGYQSDDLQHNTVPRNGSTPAHLNCAVLNATSVALCRLGFL
ncbi:unnamed protein product [Acanthoscelides obtectus]|uniref:Uncharacterized protein n=1 Tax=Acanthoscelides obtectus TaxID=200917 RepID=A0A9P0KMU6_ACAOB|nr:unnamed protein product [Acanthoscelides obtectus]CAK1631397.1 hypothetical protein AOBTE_LOCUS6930 [Acanthoscelides obtectus]